MVTITQRNMIEVGDWDQLVEDTYGRPYNFQQQNDCQDRGTYTIRVPDPDAYDFENDTIPEKVNGSEMGVSFKAWLARDPEEWGGEDKLNKKFSIQLFWERNFYPAIEVVANDLHAKGLLPEGEYIINIDW